MDLYQIRYFLTIAETGNFSRAAERLYLSQPSLSAGIKKLEQELGVSLFERGGRRTVLTAAGRSFMKKASVIMEQYQAALNELKRFNDETTLRVGVLSTMRVTVLADLVSRFQYYYPHVTIELHDGTLKTLQNDLEQGDVDVILTVLSLRGVTHPMAQADSQTSNTVFRQPLLLAVPLKHPFAQRTSVRLAELDGQPFIDRISCEFFPQECQLLDAANIHPKVVYRASHEEWVISLIQAGLGLCIMPYWHEIPGIKYLPVSDLDFERTIGLKWRQHQRSDLVEQFCDFAASYNWESNNLALDQLDALPGA